MYKYRLKSRMSIDTLRGMRHVLFVCNHNAGRSQMTQAFFERHDGVPVRSFFLQLAHRRTRDCLRAAVCEPLALV